MQCHDCLPICPSLLYVVLQLRSGPLNAFYGRVGTCWTLFVAVVDKGEASVLTTTTTTTKNNTNKTIGSQVRGWERTLIYGTLKNGACRVDHTFSFVPMSSGLVVYTCILGPTAAITGLRAVMFSVETISVRPPPLLLCFQVSSCISRESAATSCA